MDDQMTASIYKEAGGNRSLTMDNQMTASTRKQEETEA